MESGKRHMVNLSEVDYIIIRDFCHEKNLIIGKWISSTCIKHIKTILSGSLHQHEK